MTGRPRTRLLENITKLGQVLFFAQKATTPQRQPTHPYNWLAKWNNPSLHLIHRTMYDAATGAEHIHYTSSETNTKSCYSAPLTQTKVVETSLLRLTTESWPQKHSLFFFFVSFIGIYLQYLGKFPSPRLLVSRLETAPHSHNPHMDDAHDLNHVVGSGPRPCTQVADVKQAAAPSPSPDMWTLPGVHKNMAHHLRPGKQHAWPIFLATNPPSLPLKFTVVKLWYVIHNSPIKYEHAVDI